MTQSAKPPPNQDLAALANLIQLPEPPLVALFEQFQHGGDESFGPSDTQLVAVLRFSPDALGRILAQSQTRVGSRVSAEAVRPWFPDDLKSALDARADSSGALVIKGRKYDAKPFARAPFLNGYFVALDELPYLVLVLQST
jgi:hypothetical protein